MTRRLDPARLGDFLPPGGLTYVQGCSGHSGVLAGAAMAAGAALGAMEFTGIFVPGLNHATWLANPDCRVRSFFMTPELREAGDAVRFLPYGYADVRAHLRQARINAALFAVVPPDAAGICSFGTVADAIGRHVASFVPDRATVQTRLGKIPDAVLRSLTGRRGHRRRRGDRESGSVRSRGIPALCVPAGFVHPFRRGDRAGGGLSLVVLPSDAGRGTISRMDVDVVVTEHGAADLRVLDHHARALVAVAARF
jgi:acyl-CoA hydrolase